MYLRIVFRQSTRRGVDVDRLERHEREASSDCNHGSRHTEEMGRTDLHASFRMRASSQEAIHLEGKAENVMQIMASCVLEQELLSKNTLSSDDLSSNPVEVCERSFSKKLCIKNVKDVWC